MSESAQLAAAAREIARLGLVAGTSGNVSLRRGNGLMITPTGCALAAVTDDQIVSLDADGATRGVGRPSSEWQLHLAVLRARPDCAAVVHTHSPHATAASALRRAIPAVHYSVIAAGGDDIPCAPYATPGSAALAEGAAAALARRDATLLAHHGVVTVGATLDAAIALAVMVEDLARIWLLLRAACDDPPVLDAAEMAALREAWAAYRGNASG